MTIRRAVPALLVVLLALVLPAASPGAVFFVNSTEDQPDANPGSEGCKTSVPSCTLRAAIQESNASPGVKDEITFDPMVFEGQLLDTITAGSALPAIEFPAAIDGFPTGVCSTAAGFPGPCAGLKGFGLSIKADGVTVEGLAITEASIGLEVNADDVEVSGNWFGVKLNGTAGGNTSIGLFVAPHADGATIGGTEAADRNVIANTSGAGLLLEGASEATIQGNYVGVGPNGETKMANARDVTITNRAGLIPSEDVKAEDNEVGATVEGDAATSDECDGGCNVISGSQGVALDLNGDLMFAQKPATGPTLVHGNFVGLDKTGTGTVSNSGIGIWAGKAGSVTVGGYPLGDANYVSSGIEGIVSENGEDFIARGNWLGYGSDGSAVTPTGSTGIFVLAQSVGSGSSIEANHVRGTNYGVLLVGLAGHITGNETRENIYGIRLQIGSGGGLIASNTVEGSALDGILVESFDNEIRANEVFDAGGAGIAVAPPLDGIPLTGNLVGGSTAEKENTIEGSGGPAIEILEQAGEPGSTTEIARNRGSGNGGAFIDLVDSANEGIVPPSISSAMQSSASGTSLPEATIRVFSKAKAEAGELQGFLGETVADGSGNWKLTFPAVAAGTLVTATQTSATHATSELAGAVATMSESTGGGGGPTPVPADTTPPTVKITKAPKAQSKSTTAKFKFKASEAGSTFQCKLDKGKFKKCASPKTYKKLKPGKHVFKVRAIDKAGNVGKPAKRKFQVLKS